ncbi:MAG: Ni,Fe-hydrogenase III large subunit [Methylococcaceae bacterium]|nr:MAG: Ni,Fe-hydrogenase III large subunit [Methylococcaceae bacterium]
MPLAQSQDIVSPADATQSVAGYVPTQNRREAEQPRLLENVGTMDGYSISACLEQQGDTVLLRCVVPAAQPLLPSQALAYPGADRLERHAQDLWGVRFQGHPTPQRWTRHQAWSGQQFPLHDGFPTAGTPQPVTPPDNGYPFLAAQGAGVYEIPVGPVHAGIIEPGHFRFQAVGETVLNLEERLGYVHKGIEKIAVGRDAFGLARLAGRVSGDSTVAHAWAACMAMEQAAGLSVPPRALLLRAILAERERIANHLGDIGAMCNDVAFAFANYQFSRLRELWQRDNAAWFGHRLLMDCIVPGGVAADLTEQAAAAMQAALAPLKRELEELRPILAANSILQNRLQTAGELHAEIAAQYGCLGYVGRASSGDFDRRRDHPYAPYDHIHVTGVCYHTGDVAARLDVRYDEIGVALDLLEQFLARLQPGLVCADWPQSIPAAEGLGLVEGWRGETLAYVRFDAKGRIARYFPRDPSAFNWYALEKLIHDNIVPDFPLCNKSVNGSYSGQDL